MITKRRKEENKTASTFGCGWKEEANEPCGIHGDTPHTGLSQSNLLSTSGGRSDALAGSGGGASIGVMPILEKKGRDSIELMGYKIRIRFRVTLHHGG